MAPISASDTTLIASLVELHGNIEEAIAREKAMKAWKRDWKIKLIERSNPQWLDLWEQINA